MLNRGLDKLELLRIVEAVANEKSIDKELVIDSMESAIKRAALTKFGNDNNIEVNIDRESGDIKIQKVLEIVEKVEDSAREITLKEGLFVGYTSGAAFQAVNILNGENEFNDDSCVVIVFPDHGSRYLSKIYSDEWMNNQGFYDRSFYQPKKNTINYI